MSTFLPTFLSSCFAEFFLPSFCQLFRDVLVKIFVEFYAAFVDLRPGGGVLPIMAYTGRLRPKGVPVKYSKFDDQLLLSRSSRFAQSFETE